MPETEADPFFIGWLSMPRAYARLLAPTALLLILIAGIAAVLIARGQRSPGLGTWQERPTTFVGIVYAEPYAMIRIPPAEPGNSPRTLFLVEEGKFGAQTRVLPYDGQSVEVGGLLLSRGDRLMLELATGDAGLHPVELPESEQTRLKRSAPLLHGSVSLRGEIVDSKCYLGAMKPGGRQTHKGCAVLCLKGGIPPLFVTRAESETPFLLTNSDGERLDPKFFAHVGDSVLLDGIWEDWDDLPVLKVAAINP